MNLGWSDISLREYHESEGLSSSSLKLLLKSPAAYAMREPFGEETAAQLQGSALHCLVLEPERFNKSFKVMQEGERRTAKLKAEAAKKDLALLPWKDFVAINKWNDAILEHPEAKQLIEMAGPVEQSGMWFSERHNVNLKIRPDKLVPSIRTIVDLKTISTARTSKMPFQDAFIKAVENYSYYLQAALYLTGASIIEGVKMDRFAWIAIEKENPYNVAVFEANEEFIAIGAAEVEKALDAYYDCNQANSWPKQAPQGIVKIGPSKWMTRNI